MDVQVSLFYGALHVLVLIGLSIRVVALRRRLQVGIGTGGDRKLELAVRAQANFCEYVPLALLMLLLLEVNAVAPLWALHGLGVMLLAGRLLHGFYGLNRSPGATPGRFVGTLLTWLMLLFAAIAGLLGLALGN